MENRKIELLIDALRATKAITSLQKDILDTWDALQKNPFDAETAQKQIVSNNKHHPDIAAAIRFMPNVITKPFNMVTQEDMMFNLRCQLEGLVAKELELRTNGKKG